MSEDGEIVLTVADRELRGWTSERVTVGIERCPNDFEIALTAVDPAELGPDVAQPGDGCQVTIGGDLVITGYVNRLRTGKTAEGHTITVTGRGKMQDPVDCSAEWPGGQIVNANILQIAQQLLSVYGLTVTCTAPTGPVVPQFNVMVGETAWDIIERCARWANILAYEGTDGNLILAQAGGSMHASGLEAGWNLVEWDFEASDDHCYALYSAYRLSMDLLSDLGTGGNLIGSAADPNVKRHRRKFIVSEAGAAGQNIAQARANWEATRQRGRAAVVHGTADSWRDSGGKLWTPNWQVPVTIPGRFSGTPLTISEVNFIRDKQGTVAKITAMDKSAFTPEPIALLPAIPDFDPPPAP